MSWITGSAELATSAAGVYLTHNPTSDELASAFFYNADKLVPDSAIETGVAARDLDIRIADSG
jgi:hypothetical protein